jgi:hypothetical protein
LRSLMEMALMLLTLVPRGKIVVAPGTS